MELARALTLNFVLAAGATALGVLLLGVLANAYVNAGRRGRRR